MCGHATLAAAWVVFNALGFAGERVRFNSASGPLYVTRSGQRLTLDFLPACDPITETSTLEHALGVPICAAAQARDLLIEVDSGMACEYQLDFPAIAALDTFAVMLTAPERIVISSAAFLPPQGCPKTRLPVRPTAPGALVGRQTRQKRLHARQPSARGGELFCEMSGDRVSLSGEARCYLKGDILL